MSFPNLSKYADFEKAIKKVGYFNLMQYVKSKGHRIDKFDRNMKMIRYTLQHGPYSAGKIFHVAENYPSHIIYLYGRYAEELAEKMEKEKNE